MSTPAVAASHPWLAGHVHLPGHGVLALPSGDGVQAFIENGRQAWIAQLAGDLGLPADPAVWRLLDESPPVDPAGQHALLARPRPDRPELLDQDHQPDGSWQLQLRLPLDLVQLDGHFARAPVVPGVLQVGWALELAASRLGTPAACIEIEALKFQRLLRPGDRTGLALARLGNGKLQFAYRNATDAYSSGRCVFTEPPHG